MFFVDSQLIYPFEVLFFIAQSDYFLKQFVAKDFLGFDWVTESLIS
jgi:hypothetical protein